MICPHCGKETDPAPVVEKQPEKLHNNYACLNPIQFVEQACDGCNFELYCSFVGKGDYTRLKHLHATSHRRTQETRKDAAEGDSAQEENSRDSGGK